MTQSVKRIVAITTALSFLLSLFFECYLVNHHASIGSFGLVALLLGWIGFDNLMLIWLANPLFIISYFLFLFSKRFKLTFVLSLIGFILALSFMYVDEIVKDEAGNTGLITSYLLGYWLWLSALFLVSASSLIQIIKDYNNQ